MGTHPLVKTFSQEMGYTSHRPELSHMARPHQTAKEAGECSPAMNPGEERPGLEQLLQRPTWKILMENQWFNHNREHNCENIFSFKKIIAPQKDFSPDDVH